MESPRLFADGSSHNDASAGSGRGLRRMAGVVRARSLARGPGALDMLGRNLSQRPSTGSGDALVTTSEFDVNAALVSGLFSPEVRVVASPLRYDAGDLRGDERALVRGVVEKREREFATGRVLARELLRAHSHPDFELLRDDDRVPRWPSDVVGSISHTAGRGEGLCVVAVSSIRDRRGVGVDVEPDEAVSAGLEAQICLPSEQAWIEAHGPDQLGRRCRLVFSIKEAVYKAFFPTVRKVWGFMEVEVEIDLSAESFSARLPESAGRAEIEGRVLRREGWILSGVDYA